MTRLPDFSLSTAIRQATRARNARSFSMASSRRSPSCSSRSWRSSSRPSDRVVSSTSLSEAPHDEQKLAPGSFSDGSQGSSNDNYNLPGTQSGGGQSGGGVARING